MVRIWILLSALLVVSGWFLSAIHQLNGVGYGVVFALAGAAFFFWRRKTKWRPPKNPAQWFHKFCRRSQRPAPLIFLALALLALLAGALYAPLNGSSIAYRIPRVMHWLAAGQWHWIRTLDVRINIAGCDFEWLFAPLILLTHSDRFLFLFNWFSFLLLPGLIFSTFTRLAVHPRVAWWWMWLLPSGWCFIMQAGSTLNDAFATTYALAAVDFALRARENKNVGDLWLALMAAALATGVKQTNILLALIGLMAIGPELRLLFKRPLSSLAIIVVCLLISALPMIIFNLHNTGHWSGVTPNSWAKNELHSPVWGVIGNIFCLGVQNLKPPVFPLVNSWNAAMKHFLQTSFGAHFAGFEEFGRLSFGVAETSAALGLGISLLILISFLAARHYRRTPGTVGVAKSPARRLWFLRWTPWALLLVFMAKVGSYENGRHLAPYYIFLFPSLLHSSGQSVLVKRRWWQSFALLVMTVAALLLVISRDRPLFPAQTVTGWLEAGHPNSKLVSNISRTYTAAPDFDNQRLFLRKNLPPDEPVLGYAAMAGEAESSMWLPYGRRQILRVLPDDTPEQLRSSGIHFVVVEDHFLRETNETIQQWLARYNGVLIKQWEFLSDPYAPPERYYLVQLQNP
jgi:hypothetical protein